MDVQIACICPPKADGAPRHERDTVTLPDVLDFRRTITVQQTIALRLDGIGATLPEITGVLMETYVLHCIDAWSVLDAEGKPVPPTKAEIAARLLPRFDEAEKVADAADDLYTDTVALPLVMRAVRSLLPTSTDGSTSPSNGSGGKRRKRSRPSSTTSSPMVVTGPMAASPGGVSSSLPS
jgi:hypothetical protein